MKRYRSLPAVSAAIVGLLAAFAFSPRLHAAPEDPVLAPFEFVRSGADRPEDAAIALFRGYAARSPKDFVRHLPMVCGSSLPECSQLLRDCG